MKKLKAMLSALLFLLVLIYALAFSAKNSDTLMLNFLISDPIGWPAALWLGLALILGVTLGLLSGVALYSQQKMQIRRLSKELNETKQRLNKLI